MSYVIDLSAIKTGGGLQLATNFLSASEGMLGAGNVHFIVSSHISKRLIDSGFSVIGTVPDDLIGRAYFEYIIFPILIRKLGVRSIYTFFGAGMPVTGSARSVVSVAYPIICYPESRYWEYVPFLEKLKKRLWNFVRVSRLKRADVVFCETHVMRERLAQVLPPQIPILVSPPSASEFIADVPAFDRRIKGGDVLEVLVLSGVAYHKNTWRLYEVACILSKRGLKVRFVCSFGRGEFVHAVRNVLGGVEVDAEVLERNFDFVGSVRPNLIGALYARCPAILSLSDLESFSNNYMEAWKTSSILVCSDRDFSRAICRGSAFYCEPHDPETVVSALAAVIDASDEKVTQMLQFGKSYLGELPSQHEKAELIWQSLGFKK